MCSLYLPGHFGRLAYSTYSQSGGELSGRSCFSVRLRHRRSAACRERHRGATARCSTGASSRSTSCVADPRRAEKFAVQHAAEALRKPNPSRTAGAPNKRIHANAATNCLDIAWSLVRWFRCVPRHRGLNPRTNTPFGARIPANWRHHRRRPFRLNSFARLATRPAQRSVVSGEARPIPNPRADWPRTHAPRQAGGTIERTRAGRYRTASRDSWSKATGRGPSRKRGIAMHVGEKSVRLSE